MAHSLFQVKSALLSGLFILVGTLVGSGIAGYFAVRTQTMMSMQQEKILDRQIAQSDRQELKSIITDYSDVLTDYYRLITEPQLNAAEIDQFAKRAFKSAFQITLIVSIDLGQQTLELNDVLLSNLHAKSQERYSSDLETLVMQKVVGWMLLAKGELKILEYSAKPENLPGDLLRLLLRGAQGLEGKE